MCFEFLSIYWAYKPTRRTHTQIYDETTYIQQYTNSISTFNKNIDGFPNL